MGQAILTEAVATPDTRIVAGVCMPPFPETPFPCCARIGECTVPADVIIDFTRPESIDELLEYAVRTKTPLVIATTGFSPEQLEKIVQAARYVPILHAANMSLGVNVLLALSKSAAKALVGFDIEIIEKHHNQKVDAPSGTAVTLMQGINDALTEPLEPVYDRHAVRQTRGAREIGMHAVRGGTIPGEHDVLFAGADEVVTLSHVAYSRRIFAKGALRAAAFLVGRAPRLYSMQDMLAGEAHPYLQVQEGITLVTLRVGAAQWREALRAARLAEAVQTLSDAEGGDWLFAALTEAQAESFAAACAEIAVPHSEKGVKLFAQRLEPECALDVVRALREEACAPFLTVGSESTVSVYVRSEQREAAVAIVRKRMGV